MQTTLAYAISIKQANAPEAFFSTIHVDNSKIVISEPSQITPLRSHLLTFDDLSTDQCGGGGAYAQIELSNLSLDFAINSSSCHTLAIEAVPFCFLDKEVTPSPCQCAVLPLASTTYPPAQENPGLIGPITFFVANTRASLNKLNALLRVDASKAENINDNEPLIPVGFGKDIYCMPPFHRLVFSTNSAADGLVNAVISPDTKYTDFFRVKLPRGLQGANLFRALLQDRIDTLSSRSQDADIIVMVSGIDSFIPAILLARDAKIFLHVVASKHMLGIFQAYLVRTFFNLTGLSKKLVIINTKWGVFPEPPSKRLIDCEEYSMLGQSGFLHKYFIDIVAREYVSRRFLKPIIVTGDTIGIYSAFNGTLQRNRPFILGRLRGSLRRLMKSRFLARVLALLFSPRFGWEESCARALASIVFSAHSDGRFTSYTPSLSYLLEGFASEPLHIYFKSVVKAFSSSQSGAFDFAGAIGFLHRTVYLHPAIRRGAELDALYGMGHSFVNTSLAFVPFFSPRDSIPQLLFSPKWLQFTILSQLISPVTWSYVFDKAVEDAPPEIINALDDGYYNLLDRFRRGPLGY